MLMPNYLFLIVVSIVYYKYFCGYITYIFLLSEEYTHVYNTNNFLGTFENMQLRSYIYKTKRVSINYIIGKDDMYYTWA